jgi:hypothetical protein
MQVEPYFQSTITIGSYISVTVKKRDGSLIGIQAPK